jgi:hypothetical protein
VEVIFENGQEWSARFDVKHYSEEDNDTNLRDHIKGFLSAMVNPAGIKWVQALPKIRRDEQIAAMLSHYTDAERKEWQDLLNLLEGKV